MHGYVFWRLATVPFIARHVGRWIIIVVAIALWLSFILIRVLERYIGRLGGLPELIASDWIGVVFLLFVCLLTADIVTGFGFFMWRAAPSVRTWALLAAGVLSVIAMVNAHRAPVVRNYEVKIAGLPAERDGTVIVFASDLHIGEMLDGDWLSKRVEEVQALHPDMVVMGGDLIEGHGGESHFVPILQRLSAPLGVWAVTGNHEYYRGFDASVKLFRSAGMRVLEDEWAEVAPGLVIAGVDDLTARRRFNAGPESKFVENALANRPAGVATVFISHTPWQAETAANAGAGLMLSGHTHNGQIWPFTYAVQTFYPYIAGRYEVGGMALIVCRGTGTWGPRMRLWYPSELVRVTLRRG
jgi:hypothetical protein